MISVTQGIAYRKGEIVIFTGNETIPCPVCRGHVLEGLRIAMPDFLTIPDGETLNRRLAYAVRLVANSGNWVQHRSALTAPD